MNTVTVCANVEEKYAVFFFLIKLTLNRNLMTTLPIFLSLIKRLKKMHSKLSCK